MEIINQTMEYALSDLFMTWWYIIAIVVVWGYVPIFTAVAN